MKWVVWLVGAGVGVVGGLLALAIAIAPSGPTAAAPASAGSPASGGSAGAPSLNNSFRTAAIDACVQPLSTDATPAYTLDGAALPFTVATGHEPGTRPRCPAGDLRILELRAFAVNGQPAYVRRGGCQEPCRVRQATVMVLASDLAQPVTVLAPAVLAGDGAPAAGCARQVHDAPSLVRSGLGHMYYKTPGEISGTLQRTGIVGVGAKWSNYGDAGRVFVSPDGTHADYNYVLWNLPRSRSGGPLPGGGIVEAVIAEGQALSLCAVPQLRLPSFNAHGAGNGSVSFGYARVAGGGSGPPIYGWVLLGYRYHNLPFRATTTA